MIAAVALSHPVALADDSATPAAPSPVVKDSADSSGIQDVVVTARRREEKAQDVPVSVTSIDALQIQRDNLDTITSIQQAVPNTTITAFNPRQVTIGVRGIGNTAGSNNGLDTSVGVFLDGVYLSRPGELGFDLEDVDHIELLRGPQGTLFGKNTTGGALIINTAKPTFTPEATVEGSYGNYFFKQFKGSVSGPVAGDKLAIRLSAYDTNRDGYLSNPTINGRDNSRNQQGVRGQALFVPNDDFTLRVIAAYQAQNEVAGVYEYLNSLPQAGAGKSFLQRANQYTSANSLSPFSPNANPYSYQTSVTDYFNEKGHQDFLSAEANWDLHWATLTSITGYDHYYFVPNNDHDYTSLPIITAFGVADKNTHISQELRLASPSNQTVEWVSGLYYFNQRFYNFGYNLLGSASPYFYGALGAAPSATQQALNGFGWNSSSMTRTSSESVFGQATYHLDDRWSVTGGLRNTLEEKSFGYYQYIASNPNGLSTATAQSLLNTVFGSSNDSVRSNALSGTAGLSFKINDEATTYGSYSRGYKSAGLNVGNLTSSALAVGATSVLKPEKADAFELGLKTQTPDKRLVFNNALFETLLANYQTNESVLPAGGTTSSTFLGNVGFIRSRGIESELTYIPLPGLKLSASGSFTDAIYRSFHNAPCSPEASAVGQTVCDLTNQRVANTPKWTGNLSAEYSRTVIDGFQGYVAGQYAYRSGQFLTVDNSRYGYQGGYGVTNLRVGVRTDNGNYDLSFWVNNLFSSHYLLNVQDSASYQGAWGYPGDPLTLGTTLRLKF